MSAAKEKIFPGKIAAWLAMLFILLVAMAIGTPTASAKTLCTPQNRFWENSARMLQSRPIQMAQSLELQREKSIGRYNDASGCTLAAESTASPEAKGGTYLLRDPENGQVVRTGRTNDLARRELEHSRDPALNKYDFEEVHRTDNYAEQRGLEQNLHDQYNPPLNKIRPISPTNPNVQKYLDAAKSYLKSLEDLF